MEPHGWTLSSCGRIAEDEFRRRPVSETAASNDSGRPPAPRRLPGLDRVDCEVYKSQPEIGPSNRHLPRWNSPCHQAARPTAPTMARRARSHRLAAWHEAEWLVLAALVLAVYFSRLTDLTIRGEESRWARVAQEMLDSGDWIVPRQQGDPFPDRPPLNSWAMMLASRLTGQLDLVAIRLPTVIATLLITLLIYCLWTKFSLATRRVRRRSGIPDDDPGIAAGTAGRKRFAADVVRKRCAVLMALCLRASRGSATRVVGRLCAGGAGRAGQGSAGTGVLRGDHHHFSCD